MSSYLENNLQDMRNMYVSWRRLMTCLSAYLTNECLNKIFMMHHTLKLLVYCYDK
jgi:hypothetical protein